MKGEQADRRAWRCQTGSFSPTVHARCQLSPRSKTLEADPEGLTGIKVLATVLGGTPIHRRAFSAADRFLTPLSVPAGLPKMPTTDLSATTSQSHNRN